MAISIKVDNLSEVAQFAAKGPERVRKAIARSMNRAMGSGRTLMKRLIVAETGLPSKDVAEGLPLKQASADRLEANLTAPYKRIPLIKFGARGPRPSRGRGTGVTYKLKSGRGRDPHAFITTVGNGHEGVFERVTGANRRGPAPNRSQLPIRELKGPSLAAVFQKFERQGQARVEEALKTNLDHELGRVMRNEDVGAVIAVEGTAG